MCIHVPIANKGALLLYLGWEVAFLRMVCDHSGSPRVRAMIKGQDYVPFRAGVPKIRSPVLLSLSSQGRLADYHSHPSSCDTMCQKTCGIPPPTFSTLSQWSGRADPTPGESFVSIILGESSKGQWT